MGYKMNGFSGFKESPAKHGKFEDFQYGKKGHNPDTMSADHEDFHAKQSGESPAKQKDFNKTGSKASTTPGYNPKSGNFNWKGSSKARKLAKWVGKGSKFLGSKALGVAGMMMATSSKADQPKKGKGTYTSDITKMKGYKKK